MGGKANVANQEDRECQAPLVSEGTWEIQVLEVKKDPLPMGSQVLQVYPE